MGGVDPKQLLELAVRPALRILGDHYGGTAAEQLVMGTAAVESGLVWLKQIGKGPALGLWQMEPFTFNDLTNRMPAGLRSNLDRLSAYHSIEDHELAWNLRFAAAMCRMKYRDAKPALPNEWDLVAMESYHKHFYNSALGATQPGEFRRAWERLIQPQAERMWPT